MVKGSRLTPFVEYEHAFVFGTRGGIRTHTPSRAADFESAESTVPPLGQ